MEWINPEYGTNRTRDEIISDNGIKMSLDEYGSNTSLYAASLAPNITYKDMYIMTIDGKAYPGDSVQCIKTKTKDVITNKTVNVIISSMNGVSVLQFIAFFKDGTQIDARGDYARTSLRIFKKKKRVKGAVK